MKWERDTLCRLLSVGEESRINDVVEEVLKDV